MDQKAIVGQNDEELVKAMCGAGGSETVSGQDGWMMPGHAFPNTIPDEQASARHALA
jgi:hypothetical protein